MSRIQAVYREPLDLERLAAVLVAEVEELEAQSQLAEPESERLEAVNE